MYYCRRNQFGLQVQQRWKLQKNFKRKLQQDAFSILEAKTDRPAEILIGNRPISFKKVKKTAVAMLSAQKKQAGYNTPSAASDKVTTQYSTPKQAVPESNSAIVQDSLPSRCSIKVLYKTMQLTRDSTYRGAIHRSTFYEHRSSHYSPPLSARTTQIIAHTCCGRTLAFWTMQSLPKSDM